MSRARVFVSLALLALVLPGLHAQSTLPVLNTAMPAQTLVAGGPSVTLDLATHFKIDNVSGSIVQFDTIKGKFNVAMLSTDAPGTVTNFLGYAGRGNYEDSLIHRSISGFVIQGGGFTVNTSAQINPVPTQAAIKNEYKVSNTRGTLAMAKTDAGPDTATSQWFINLADNGAGTAKLDTTNGGYTVFGRVMGTGMTVVDAIATIPTYDASGSLGSAFTNMPLLNNSLTLANLVIVNSVQEISQYPDASAVPAALRFTATSTNAAVATATAIGSSLTLKPIGVGTATINVTATDTNDNATSPQSLTVTVVAAPLFTTQPPSGSVTTGQTARLNVVATGSPTFQWQRNGVNIDGADAATMDFSQFAVGSAGLFTAVATSSGVSTVSNPGIVGINAGTSAFVGTARVLVTGVVHPNTKKYDQVALEGAAAGITAAYSPDPAATRVTRMSYIDANDDIVQVEFAGHGTLSLVLDDASGPANPVKYNQNFGYMKGHPGIVITGADETSNVTVFAVGRATANDPTGTYKITEPISTTNNPANNKSPLFEGKQNTTYDGVADVGFIAISSGTGKFGGLRAANARFSRTRGYTGVYAPGIAFQGPVFVGDINAGGTGKPLLLLGSCSDVRVTGGGLVQLNHQPVRVSGITQLKFMPGTTAAGTNQPARLNHAVLRQNETDVTSTIVVNPQ